MAQLAIKNLSKLAPLAEGALKFPTQISPLLNFIGRKQCFPTFLSSGTIFVFVQLCYSLSIEHQSATHDLQISTIEFSEKSARGRNWTQVHQNIRIMKQMLWPLRYDSLFTTTFRSPVVTWKLMSKGNPKLMNCKHWHHIANQCKQPLW